MLVAEIFSHKRCRFYLRHLAPGGLQLGCCLTATRQNWKYQGMGRNPPPHCLAVVTVVTAQGSRLGSLGSLSSRPRLNGKLRLKLRLPRDITSTCIALLRSLPQQGSHRAERTAVMAVPTGDPASLNPFWWAQDSNALASPSFRVLHPDRGSSSEAIWTVWRYSVTRVL